MIKKWILTIPPNALIVPLCQIFSQCFTCIKNLSPKKYFSLLFIHIIMKYLCTISGIINVPFVTWRMRYNKFFPLSGWLDQNSGLKLLGVSLLIQTVYLQSAAHWSANCLTNIKQSPWFTSISRRLLYKKY